MQAQCCYFLKLSPWDSPTSLQKLWIPPTTGNVSWIFGCSRTWSFKQLCSKRTFCLWGYCFFLNLIIFSLSRIIVDKITKGSLLPDSEMSSGAHKIKFHASHIYSISWKDDGRKKAASIPVKEFLREIFCCLNTKLSFSPPKQTANNPRARISRANWFCYWMSKNATAYHCTIYMLLHTKKKFKIYTNTGFVIGMYFGIEIQVIQATHVLRHVFHIDLWYMVIALDFPLEYAGFFPREKSRKTREIFCTSRKKSSK